MRKHKTFSAIVLLLLGVFTVGFPLGGCGLLGDVAPLPFAKVTAVQLFDQPNFTIALSVEEAVSNPSQIEKVNWVFGDGGGFVEGAAGQATITHRYDATGDYTVTAYVFAGGQVAAQITETITAAPNDDGTPGPNPTPGDLPEKIKGPNPTDGAENVSVETLLTWTSGAGAVSHDVYLGTIEASVDAAASGDLLGIFRGNQTETKYDPPSLVPDTEYFWRVDERNVSGVTKGTVFSFKMAKAPKQAKDFQPADGVGGVPVAQVLRWTAGNGATSHDVYFGKNQTDVMNSTKDTTDTFKGNQTGTNYDPEDEGAEIAGQLLPDTTYYWRIDEVGLGGTLKGAILSFTTKAAPPQVTSPVPANGATDVDVSQNQSWSAVATIESFDVYFGDDQAAVSAATRSSPEFKGNQSSKAYSPATLAGSLTYYWRIDTLDPGGTTKGQVFSFTTATPPPQVVSPFTPAHNATNVSVATLLVWQAGSGGTTVSFDIYFGTDEGAVNSGAASVAQGNQDVSNTQFDPLGLAALSPDTAYFWRIDAVGPGGKTTGAVLRFRTGALPGQATDPAPADGAKGRPLDVNLGWTAGLNALSHDVYFGTDQTAVQNADHFDAEFVGNVAGTTFDPGDLEGNTQYFWRVDAGSNGGTTKGSVWKLKTAPAEATDPTPLDADTGIAINTNLSWTAGAGAVSHDVYLGTNQAIVTSATIVSPEFKGNQAGTSYDPPANLDGFTTYYWRIDEMNLDGTTKGVVWSFITAAGEAAEPIDPDDGATGVRLEPTLMWSAGAGAVSHDVYLGTDESGVERATRASPEFKHNQPGTSYTPPSPLAGNTNYFWRIDEVDSDGNATKGPVWQFQTTIGQAKDPVPTDGQTDVDVNTSLSWTAGSGATSHCVYLGTNEAAVRDATPSTAGIFKGCQTATTYTPPDPLTGQTPYYWRIDEVGPVGTVKGEVWSFETGVGQATDPIPADGATGVDVDSSLSWTAASGAVSHDIYRGTKEADVEQATRASPEFKGNQAGSTTYTPPSPLEGNTNHFWRIDEVDGDGNATKGPIWQFQTTIGQAKDPAPTDGEAAVDVITNLSWTAGSGATGHRVYLGTNEAAVEAATTGTAGIYKGSQTATTYTPPAPLAGRTPYYWRIDEFSPVATVKGVVWSFETGVGQASNPDPADGATGVDVDSSLSWTAASGAVSHDIYLGTSESVVKDATRASGEYKGSQPGTTFDLPVPLDCLKWLYWRIDEVDIDGNATKGPVWQFATNVGHAKDPVPVDGQTGVDVNTTLSWTAGCGATSHCVYLGTNQAAVNAATPGTPGIFKGCQTATTYTPEDPLAGSTTYYWRIDEVGPVDTIKGVVWSFTTGIGQATDPIPADGATGVDLRPLLTWTPDADAVSHRVYFGTSASAVENATTASSEYQGSQLGTTFDLGILNGLTWYYWRIDEVDIDSNVAKGEVWRFRTGPGRASSPIPVDFAPDIELDTLLRWTAGIGAVQHRVYFGTSLAAVTNADPSDPEYQGAQSGTVFDPGGLSGDTYYWRIDEVGSGGAAVTTGEVWRFTTLSPPAQASSPNPFDGATGIVRSVTLSWAAAARATEYDVYFSTVQADVISGAAFQGRRSTTTYNPGSLAGTTTYYWRIDTVNDAGTTEGVVWSFTTQP